MSQKESAEREREILTPFPGRRRQTSPSSAPHEWVQGRGTWGSSRPYSEDPRRWHARVSARAPEAMHGVGEHLTTPRKRRGPCEG
ncbi:hypothetical protein B5X24_HaOG215764 [Helicoverpa armigera]|uniref:Uncharacterized protein n=1 Tax=Helicoverpa armigera TaxID=29058 RepID=A0A2W1B2J6_HELAM|nr:hypothetical protein B5X24_HaOG215764 [Helicoverpa armigera]